MIYGLNELPVFINRKPEIPQFFICEFGIWIILNLPLIEHAEVIHPIFYCVKTIKNLPCPSNNNERIDAWRPFV